MSKTINVIVWDEHGKVEFDAFLPPSDKFNALVAPHYGLEQVAEELALQVKTLEVEE